MPLGLNLIMFGLFKRDPIREAVNEAKLLLQIPVELIGATGEANSSANRVLLNAGLKGKFSEEALIAEIAAFHFKTVVATMIRVAGVEGGPFSPSVEEAYDRNACWLIKTVNMMMDDLRSKGVADAELLGLLVSDKTVELSTSYFVRMGLGVTEEDVLDFGRKYNPKIVALSSDDRNNALSLYYYIVRAFRISHIEDLSAQDRLSPLMEFNNTLFYAVVNLEGKVEKFALKRSS